MSLGFSPGFHGRIEKIILLRILPRRCPLDGVSLSSLVTSLLSGIVASALTYFSTRSKIRLDMTVEYDKDLHNKRLELYKQLWPKTKPLAEFTRESPLTYDTIKAVAEETREWYFDRGGIYLSKRSRKPYFRLKSLLQTVLDDKTLEQERSRPVDQPLADAILAAARNLRTSLADDIRARRGPWL